MAITEAVGSNAAKYGVANCSFPCTFRDLRSHREIELSFEHDTKASLPGDRASDVTLSVWPLKYRR